MLQAIENKSCAELRANREALTEEAAQADVKELAARYIHARTDAKQRDEKLSEQGKLITELQNENAKLHNAFTTASQQLARLTDNAREQFAELGQSLQARQKALDAVTEQLQGIDDEWAAKLNEAEAAWKAKLDDATASWQARRDALVRVHADEIQRLEQEVTRQTREIETLQHQLKQQTTA